MKQLIWSLFLLVAASAGFAQEAKPAPVFTTGGNTYSASAAKLPDNGSRSASPAAIGLIPPVQFPPEDWDVTGIRLSLLWGKHGNVGFLDIGTLANIDGGDCYGLSLAGLWNEANCNMEGIQFAGIANTVGGDAKGIQIAGLCNYNAPKADAGGLEIAIANLGGNMNGFQIGAYNQAADMKGLQIGLINTCENLSGLQIGVVNIVRNSTLPVMILLNAGI